MRISVHITWDTEGVLNDAEDLLVLTRSNAEDLLVLTKNIAQESEK